MTHDVENPVEELEVEEIIAEETVDESQTEETAASVPVEEIVEIVSAFDQDAFFQHLTDWAAEIVLEHAAPLDSTVLAQAVVAALDERDVQQAQLMEGEILVPASEDIAVIKQVVQNNRPFQPLCVWRK